MSEPPQSLRGPPALSWRQLWPQPVKGSHRQVPPVRVPGPLLSQLRCTHPLPFPWCRGSILSRLLQPAQAQSLCTC